MAYQSISREWPLERYSRLVGEGSEESKAYTSGENFCLRILSSNYLLISHKNEILENFPLVNAGVTMKGVFIGDSLLIILKLMNGTRRFRVRFKATADLSASEVCDACTRELQQYFYITTLDNVPRNAGEAADTAGSLRPETQEEPTASMKRTVSDMAKIITGVDKSKLPKAYGQAIVAQEELEAILRLCLLDVSFPSFVENVEIITKKLAEES